MSGTYAMYGPSYRKPQNMNLWRSRMFSGNSTRGPGLAAASAGGAATKLPTWAVVLMVGLGLTALASLIAFGVVYGQNVDVINDKDDCAPNPCQNGGTCYDLLNDHVCTCAVGFTGQNCASDINECASAPCQHGGTCNNFQDGRFTCSCADHYTGTLCVDRIYYCDLRPCNGHGQCGEVKEAELPSKLYTCSCDPGWTGTTCNIDVLECASNPCGQHGSCAEDVNGYKCSCNAGYEGTHCETNIDECSVAGQITPCLNGGLCVNGLSSYTCDCPAGYTGLGCETDIDDCTPNPCAGGKFSDGITNSVGTCTDSVNGYKCACTVIGSDALAAEANPLVLDDDCNVLAAPVR